MTLAEDGIRCRLPEGMAMEVLGRAPFSLLLADPALPDNPIVCANAPFEQAGYSRDAAMAATAASCRGRAPIPPQSASAAPSMPRRK
jgi:hypothetical protein